MDQSQAVLGLWMKDLRNTGCQDMDASAFPRFVIPSVIPIVIPIVEAALVRLACGMGA